MRRPIMLGAAMLLTAGVLTGCEGDTSGLKTTTATEAPTSTASSESTAAATTTAAPGATKAPPTSTTTTVASTPATKAPQSTTPPTTVATAQVSLDPTLDANFGAGSLSAGFTPDPVSIGLGSGGPESAAQVGCVGFVTANPDFELSWNGSGFLRIYFESVNQGDTTLVINAPDGSWWCGDDSFGTLHPTVDFPNSASGVYDIWVGSYAAGDNHSGMLYFTELNGMGPSTTPTTAPAAGLQFRPENTAPYGELVIQPGFSPDPVVTAITSGGQVDASYVGCAGFAATRPDLEITMTGDSALLRFYFIPSGNTDSTLIINGPDGFWWCGDDSYGTLHPTIDFMASTAGTYDIWVGTYNPGDNTPGNLYMTELDGFHP